MSAELYAQMMEELEAQRPDRARCLANVLRYLGQESPEITALNRETRGVVWSSQAPVLDEALWPCVLHPSQDLEMGRAMALLHVSCGHLFAKKLKRAWKLSDDREVRRGEQRDYEVFRLLWTLFDVLGFVQPPKVYLDAQRALGIVNGNVNPPGLIVGKDMLDRWHPRDLLFATARQAFMALPEHYPVGAGFSTSALVALLEAGFWILAPPPRGKRRKPRDKVHRAARDMLPPVRRKLAQHLAPLQGCDPRRAVIAWRNAVTHSANRFALALVGDLESAARLIRADRYTPSTLRFDQREAELIAYACSPEYRDAREMLLST